MEKSYTYLCVIVNGDDNTLKIQNYDNEEDVIAENYLFEQQLSNTYIHCYTDNPKYKDSDYLFYYRETKTDCNEAVNKIYKQN